LSGPVFAVFESVTELIGGTPVVELQRITSSNTAQIRIKLEQFSATGSSKDRIALAILQRAVAEGRLTRGGTVIEATCGNAGIALAMMCVTKGLKLTVTAPESISPERRALLSAYGARVELTPARLQMAGAISRAKELLAKTRGAFMPSQYDNPDNVAALRKAGEELVETIRADGGQIDAFVAGIGTGGTLSGIGRALKASFPAVQVIAVEPAAEMNRIQGLGSGSESAVLDRSVIDRTLTINDVDAWRMRGRLAREEGILGGISTGANVAAALRVANELGSGHRVYSVCCDTGERDFSLERFFQ
jgi:cysteine synthase